jgi:bifunctional non-homologous end joining protein LigD
MHRGQVPVVRRRSEREVEREEGVMPKGKTKPGFIRPMLCKTVPELPGGNEWMYEVKWGGQRAIVVKDGAQVRVFAENGNQLDYPHIEKTVREVSPESAVIDGEIIGLTREGKRCEPRPDCRMKLYAFDLLHINGRDLTTEPIERRKSKLCTATMDSDLLFCPSLECAPGLLLEEVQRLALQGVVAKRKGSFYEPGKCTGAWANLQVKKLSKRKRSSK